MSTTTRESHVRWALSLAMLGLGALSIYGCQESAKPGATTMAAANATPEKGGAQIWSENCARCHNLRPPTQYSGAEWAVIVHHMRIRADLTTTEQKKVTEFLKSASGS